MSTSKNKIDAAKRALLWLAWLAYTIIPLVLAYRRHQLSRDQKAGICIVLAVLVLAAVLNLYINHRRREAAFNWTPIIGTVESVSDCDDDGKDTGAYYVNFS